MDKILITEVFNPVTLYNYLWCEQLVACVIDYRSLLYQYHVIWCRWFFLLELHKGINCIKLPHVHHCPSIQVSTGWNIVSCCSTSALPIWSGQVQILYLQSDLVWKLFTTQPVSLPASQSSVIPGCTRCMVPEFYTTKVITSDLWNCCSKEHLSTAMVFPFILILSFVFI